jgi:hypothetical protein
MSLDSSSIRQTESLQAALACLDLSLESELALYRRQNLQASGALALSESDRTLDEPSMFFEADSEEISLEDLGNVNSLQGFSSQSDGLQEIGPIALSAPIDLHIDLHNVAMIEGHGSQEQRDNVVHGVGQEAGPSKREAASFLDAVEEDPETLPEPYNAEAVSKPEALERFLDPSIEDYLESSEALLKHLDNSEGTIAKSIKPTRSARLTKKPSPSKSSPAPSTWAFKLLLGVLAITLLVGVAMSILKQLTTRSRTTPVPQPSIQPSSQSSIQPSVQPSVQTTTAPVSASPATIAITPVSLKPTLKPTSTPIGPNSTPTSASSPKPTVQPSAFYAVIAPYQDDASLQRARQLVPDAFIADIKGRKRIQLAFVDDLQRAQRLVDDLKNEGFPATIVSQN